VGQTIAAVLFDMDGVLVDAREWHYEALNAALEPFGMTIARDEHLAVYDGLPTRKKLEILSKSRGLPQGLHEFLNTLKQQHTSGMMGQLCRPTFHHRFTLSRLKADGYRMAMCSNSVRTTVDAMAKLALIDPYFEFTLSNEDVSKPKPDPEIYATAIERIGATPERTLIVEDNQHGIAAAEAAGAYVLQVSGPEDVTYQRIAATIAKIERHP
jgi:beta-phosphoglucomutase-like phosphatase (HAD superfamily)